MLAAGPDDDLRVIPRFLIVLRQVDGKAVVEAVDVDPHRILRFRLVDQLIAGMSRMGSCQQDPPHQSDQRRFNRYFSL